MPASSAFRLIVGLGNPGREYTETRHNVGFILLDLLASRERAAWRHEKQWRAELARVGSVLLCKPMTFMNLSGAAVRPLAHFYKIEPAQTLVVLDDLALPLGKLRLRETGSSGGHKGLQSIIEELGTQAVPRLRVGIGGARGDTADYVLGRFDLEEQEVLGQALASAVAAVDSAQSNGFAAAMNLFN